MFVVSVGVNYSYGNAMFSVPCNIIVGGKILNLTYPKLNFIDYFWKKVSRPNEKIILLIHRTKVNT